MYYYKALQDNEGIWLVEEEYNQSYCKKSESVFTISNGGVGIRGAQDIRGLAESRGMFISGLYHRTSSDEVAELVNCPDIMLNEILYDGKLLSFDSVCIDAYDRRLNTETGELRLSATVRTDDGRRMRLSGRRFASAADRRFVCQKFEMTLIDGSIDSVSVKTGINGQITNSGISHISKTECRVLDNRYLYYYGITGNRDIEIFEDIDIHFVGRRSENYCLETRSIYKTAYGLMNAGDTLVINKIAIVQSPDCDEESIANGDNYKELFDGLCYEDLYRDHIRSMSEFWKDAAIEIEGASVADMAAIKFAQLQMYEMTPQDGGSSSIGAKGLTGEGYKGHVFWDTEIFMLPFYIHTFPEIARDLLLYRYRGLKGAREKAHEYGYDGAMYPWESANDGREETPLFAALNIYTGCATPVWSGRKEHHVTADIGYSVIDYYKTTADEKFMEKYGLEMLTEISEFWVSRATERNGRLEILDVIGPDEYTEHIDNNAFTNYMAKYVVQTTVELMKKVGKGPYTDDYDSQLERFEDFVERIYLPMSDEDGIIPQDDTFLSKPELAGFSEFRESQVKQTVLLKYSRDEVVDSQVLKQPDVVMLLNLFPNLIGKDFMRKNVEFYETHTLHDSSLSYSVHSQVCAVAGLTEMSAAFFRKALEVDLCENPKDSVDGLHAASLGGIWNCIILGFAGLSVDGGELRFSPHLPADWTSISFKTMFKGRKYRVNISADEANVSEMD